MSASSRTLWRLNPVRGWLGWSLVVFGVVWLQVALISGSRPLGPYLPVLLLGFIALEARREVVIPAAVVIGVTECLFSAGAPLLRVGSCVAVAIALLAIRRFLFREHRLTALAVCAAAALALELIEVALVAPPGRPELFLRALLFAAVTAGVTGVAAMFVLPAMRRVGFCRRLTAPRRF